MTLLDDLARYPLKTALRRAGWSEKRYLTSRTDPAFAAAADRATGQREAVLMDCITMASVLDWRAAAWLAERTAGFVEKKEVSIQVQAEVTRLLELLEQNISASAFREVVLALSGEFQEKTAESETKLLGSGEGE